MSEEDYQAALKQAEDPTDVDLVGTLALARLDATIGPGLAGNFVTHREDVTQRDGITTSFMHLSQERDGRTLHTVTAAAVRGRVNAVMHATALSDPVKWVDPTAQNLELYGLEDSGYPDRPFQAFPNEDPRPAQGSFAHEGGPPPLAQPVPRPPTRPEHLPDPSIKSEADFGGCDGSPILRREVIKGLRLFRYHRHQFPLLPYLNEHSFNAIWSEMQSRLASRQATDRPPLAHWGFHMDVPAGFVATSSTSIHNGQQGYVFSLLKLNGPVFHHAICGWVAALERMGLTVQEDHCLSGDASALYAASFESTSGASQLALAIFDQEVVICYTESGTLQQSLDLLQGVRKTENIEPFPVLEAGLFDYTLADPWIAPHAGQAHNLENHCTLIAGVFPEKIPYKLSRVTDEYCEALMGLNDEEGLQVVLISREKGQDLKFEMERLIHEMTIEDHTRMRKYTFFIKPDLGFFKGTSKMFHLEMAIPLDDNEPEHLALYEALIAKAVAAKEALHD